MKYDVREAANMRCRLCTTVQVREMVAALSKGKNRLTVNRDDDAGTIDVVSKKTGKLYFSAIQKDNVDAWIARFPSDLFIFYK